MSGENATTIDRLPIEEIALNRASGNNAANPTLAAVNYKPIAVASLSNQTAPSGVVIAGTIFAAKFSGLALWLVTLQYTTSGAGDVSLLTQIVPNPTAISGGTSSGTPGWNFDGGSPVVITGGSPVTVNTLVQTAAGAAKQVLTFITPVVEGTLNVSAGFQLALTSSLTLTNMTLSAMLIEQT